MGNKLLKGKGRLRCKLMEMVKREQKTLKAVSLELGISYRQAKRIYQSYLNGGDATLVHGNIGNGKGYGSYSFNSGIKLSVREY